MPDKDFPSGPWTGFYQYRDGKRGQMDLVLVFERGRMTGTGHDELGTFTIAGTYSSESKEAQWVKRYPGAHSIDYRGFREGSRPGIWGEWHIGPDWSGGFHIWPLGSGDEEEASKKRERTKVTAVKGGKRNLDLTTGNRPAD